MQETIQLAGFLAAEAIMRAAKKVTLSPLIIFEKADGSSHIIRIQEASPQQAVFKGEEMLRANADGAVRGVMAFDAYLNLPPKRTEAIFLQACRYLPAYRQAILAVPYRRARKPGSFAIYRLKLIAFEDQPLPATDFLAAFFRGIEKHEKGGKFWREHYEGRG